jgi:hypothetical protein
MYYRHKDFPNRPRSDRFYWDFFSSTQIFLWFHWWQGVWLVIKRFFMFGSWGLKILWHFCQIFVNDWCHLTFPSKILHFCELSKFYWQYLGEDSWGLSLLKGLSCWKAETFLRLSFVYRWGHRKECWKFSDNCFHK